jgi:hypothetical protein
MYLRSGLLAKNEEGLEMSGNSGANGHAVYGRWPAG